MDQRASVEGHLSRLKHVVVGLTVSLGIRYFLMEDEIARGFSPFQSAEKVAFGNETHGGIYLINVIDGQPNGHGFRGPHGPIGCVLVPRHVLGFLCELAEVVGRPANKIGTKKIFNVVQNARMLRQVPYALAVILVTHDRVSVAAVVVRFDPGEQVIEVATIGTHLGWRECVQRADITSSLNCMTCVRLKVLACCAATGKNSMSCCRPIFLPKLNPLSIVVCGGS